ncbi:unnamed protein product [Orchesella dallaii]|uniref:Uncharacterized protein n=1 Tax=Orchesella dallaii TaxID=48710 RepID=A0ABP1PVG8_9HEXA
MEQITKRVNNRWETGLLWRRETGFNTTLEGFTQIRQSSSNSVTVDAVLQQTGEDWRSPTVPLACRVEKFDSHVPLVRGLVSPTTVPCFFARAKNPLLDPQPVGENHAKPGSFQLPPCRETAYCLMLSLEIKFIRNPEFQQQFQQKIDHYVRR